MHTYIYTTWQIINALGTFQWLVFLWDKLTCRSASSVPSHQKFQNVIKCWMKISEQQRKMLLTYFKPLRSDGERNFYEIVRRLRTKRRSVFQTVIYYCPSVIYGLFVAKLLPYTHFSLKLWKNSWHKFRRKKKIDQNSKIFWKIFSQSRCYILS